LVHPGADPAADRQRDGQTKGRIYSGKDRQIERDWKGEMEIVCRETDGEVEM
jgi:hypothetical protein